jgi:hypothetical protein
MSQLKLEGYSGYYDRAVEMNDEQSEKDVIIEYIVKNRVENIFTKDMKSMVYTLHYR